MSSRSTSKSAATVLEVFDSTTELTTALHEQAPTTDPQTLVIETELSAVDSDDRGSESSATNAQSEPGTAVADGSSEASGSDETAELLAQQLEQLVSSVAAVEDLSRRAREVAKTDLALYDALIVSQQQYTGRMEQACAIRDQAQAVHERAFGREARSAAEPLVADAESVVQAFTDLANAWQRRASAFADEHPDIQLLLLERQARAEQARQAEALAARGQRLNGLLTACNDAIGHDLLREAHHLVEVLKREFPDEPAAIAALCELLEQRDREQRDNAARQALAACAEHQARGDLEGAVNVLEQLDVHGLSIDVSQDVFGRWSDACSRLAQTAAATLLRFAPVQGRGLILYADPAYPNGLIVFSSLGMGTGFPQGKVVTDIAILRRARPFREAAQIPATSWGGFGVSAPSSPVLSPVRH